MYCCMNCHNLSLLKNGNESYTYSMMKFLAFLNTLSAVHSYKCVSAYFVLWGLHTHKCVYPLMKVFKFPSISGVSYVYLSMIMTDNHGWDRTLSR